MARIVVFGPEGAQTFDLDQAVVTLGRSKACMIMLEDGAASRKHCVVRREDEGGFRLVDLGSANGTYVNGLKIKEHALEAEDRIKIGKTVLVFKER